MLVLKDINKIYTIGKSGDKNYQEVHALNDVSITFRDQEFVSILGQSGCGKTTLLNIVGGLDKYTSGDLIINGTSTKEYKDRDWDNYRNHKIGFVFQSYNLIPHQTVLENVELALTLSGVSKEERKNRAKEALTKVGLADKFNAKPNQLSGGQMQRVAIARALVNNPDIILADEPTGALDSKTSIQVMEILKEISKEKLIIMVTHNPELANKYSTRIVELVDGTIVKDSNPFEGEDVVSNNEVTKKHSMSFLTALSLSGKNLLTKKARTILVSFAGSIGIIGIALILSLSNGFQTYIDQVQQDTLSSYPLTLTTESISYTSALETIMNPPLSENTSDDEVTPNVIMGEIFDSVLSSSSVNDLKSFKAYVDSHEEEFSKFIFQYSYNVTTDIYSTEGVQLEPMTVFTDLIRMIGEKYNQTEMGQSSPIDYESYIERFSLMNQTVFSEMIDSQELLEGQYELVGTEFGSRWPSSYDECILVVNSDNTINDFYLYALDLVEEPSLDEIANGILNNFMNQNNPDYDPYKVVMDDIPIENILGKEYNILLASDYYEDSDDDGIFESIEKTQENIQRLTHDENKGINLKIVGVVREKENASAYSITTPIAYSHDLIVHASEYNNNSPVVKAQQASPDIDILTGEPFASSDSNEDKISKLLDYFNNISDEDMEEFYSRNEDILSQLPSSSPSTVKLMIIQYCNMLKGLDSLDEQQQAILDTLFDMTYSINTYNNNMSIFGVTDISNPYTISIYCSNFDDKQELTDLIEQYNNKMRSDPNYGESYVISYTDYAGLMMSSISVIINSITYVLIAFVSVSLIVSSIMIGIITYISVLERTKEIGILRSIGASKRDIKNVFTAESLIIGFISGSLGLIVTVLLDLPISIIIDILSGIPNVAVLPWGGALILLAISCLLTFIAGLIPSRIASKKDPVICLRSE